MSKTKETTALSPSVGADGGQPSKTYTLSIAETDAEFNENFSDSPNFFQKLQRAQDPDFLNTVSYNELMEETLPCRKAVIEGLLGTGVYMLVGAPKIGKSFLVALIAYRVSTGTDLWGYRVHGGTVLYLALEDDKKRLQKETNMKTMFTSIEQLPVTLNATQLAQVLGISRANAYSLMHSQDFPTLKIGKRMVVPKDKLMTWMEKNTNSVA